MRNDLGIFFYKADNFEERELSICLEREGWIPGAL
jgi:hypothetical protein